MSSPIQNFVIRGEGFTFSCPLPVHGDVCIGRGSEADVRVNFPEASRLHAQLRIAGASLEICDLGSTNGTFVRRERLAARHWTSLRVGEPFAFGDRILVVQLASDAQDCEKLTGRELFEERLRTELATFERTRRPFGVCVFETPGQLPLLDLLASVLSSRDVVGVLDSSATAVLLAGHAPSTVSQFGSELEAYLERRGMHSTVHYSFCPETGSTLDQLLPRSPASPTDASAETVRPPIFVAQSKAMSKVYAMVSHVAPTSTNVLIYGATGTGKDVLAHELHLRSHRRAGPFVALNCAALPDNLLESELFGYEKGAFTGAAGAKPGQFEVAHGGTLFLDEIGEMPMLAQAKLLRVVEERAVLRLGGTKLSRVDVRIIAATNRDLRLQVDRGLFRADLFYRLNGFSITLPLLRERKDEIPSLVDHFVSRAATALGKRRPIVTPEVLSLCAEYEWPGNIRELRSVIERAVLLARDGFIRPDHLPDEMAPMPTRAALPFDEPPLVTARMPMLPGCDAPVESTDSRPPSLPSPSTPGIATTEPPGFLDAFLVASKGRHGVARVAMLSREIIAEALDRCGANQTLAAKLLGVSRRALIKRIERFGFTRPRKGGSAE